MKRYKFTKTFTYDGKRYYIRANSELELGMKYQKRLEDLKANHVIINSNMTLGDWARKCVETYKTSSSEDARDRYLDFTEKYIVSEIGHYKLKDVRPIMCQSLINKYEGMSKYTIGQVYQKLNFIFRKAVDNGLINSNPAADISKPTGTLNKRRSLTAEEQEVFVKCALKHQYAIYFMLIYLCGCRPSEAAKIKYEDIVVSKERKYIHVRGTKSAAADRYVPLPDMLDDLLAGSTGYLITTSQNNTLSHKKRLFAWKSLVRDINIEMGCKMYRNQLIPPYPFGDDLSTYSLRHTYCTNLQKKGVDIRTAQYLMGHSDIKMTANIYTHTTLDSLDDSWDMINAK